MVEVVDDYVDPRGGGGEDGSGVYYSRFGVLSFSFFSFLFFFVFFFCAVQRHREGDVGDELVLVPILAREADERRRLGAPRGAVHEAYGVLFVCGELLSLDINEDCLVYFCRDWRVFDGSSDSRLEIKILGSWRRSCHCWRWEGQRGDWSRGRGFKGGKDGECLVWCEPGVGDIEVAWRVSLAKTMQG